MVKQNVIGAAVLLTALASAPAHAIDSFAVELGRATSDGVDRVGVAAGWDWQRPLLQMSDWQIGGFWVASLSYWNRGDVPPGKNEDITEIGFTPVFRIQPNSKVGLYGEAGIGLHLMSKTQLGNKQMSTAFQFGDHIGFGYRFGRQSAFDLNYRFQHLSNAHIKTPNAGINFHEVRLLYHF